MEGIQNIRSGGGSLSMILLLSERIRCLTVGLKILVSGAKVCEVLLRKCLRAKFLFLKNQFNLHNKIVFI